MNEKTILLIEEDTDCTHVVVAASDQETLDKEANSLWEHFCSQEGKKYPSPDAPGLAEFSDGGGLNCTFEVQCSPTEARRILQEWLPKNAKKEDEDTYTYM